MPYLTRTKVICGLALALTAVAGLPGHAQEKSDAPGLLRAGDRILLSVEGETQWTDTFTVRPGPQIELPVIGVVPLVDVRREAVQSYLTKALGQYLKNPVVHATTLVRVSVLGELTRPGFYDLPADALLSDAITAAGGLTREANVAKIRLDRAGTTVREGKALHAALGRAVTLDHLGVQTGDAVIIPRARDSERTARIVSIVIGVPLAIIGLTRIQ